MPRDERRRERTRQLLERYLVGHPVRIAAVAVGVTTVLMVPVLVFLVAPEIRVAMSIVAVVTLLVCFLLIVVAVKWMMPNG